MVKDKAGLHWGWIILGTCFVNFFINYSVRLGYGVILPEMIHALGFSRAAGGTIYNAYFLAYVSLTPFAGYLTDRFGAPPPPVKNLLEVMKLRLELMKLRATSLAYAGEHLVLAFDEAPAVDPDRVISLAAAEAARCRLTPDNRVRWKVGKLEDEAVLVEARELLRKLL